MIERQIKILVVDDDHSIVESVKLLLTDRGMTVLTAPDGDEALLLSKKFQPDLILLDINMPQKSGYYVATLLEQDKQTCDIPIIYLTGTSNILGNNITLNSTHKRIEKPFDEEELLESIIDAIPF